MLGINSWIGVAVCYIFGIGLFFTSRIRNKRMMRMKYIFIGMISLAGGLGGTYGWFIENTELLDKMPWCALGTTFICMSIFDLIKIYMCRTQIYGVFIKNRQFRLRRYQKMTIPTFQYFFDGFYYEDESEEEIPEYKEKNYKSGHTYPIYICEKAPYLFITDRSNYWDTIFRIIVGAFFIAAAVLEL